MNPRLKWGPTKVVGGEIELPGVLPADPSVTLFTIVLHDDDDRYGTLFGALIPDGVYPESRTPIDVAKQVAEEWLDRWLRDAASSVMPSPWNPPETLPANRFVVLVFNVPVSKGDGGYHVPAAVVAKANGKGALCGGPVSSTGEAITYPKSWLVGWTEVPS